MDLELFVFFDQSSVIFLCGFGALHLLRSEVLKESFKIYCAINDGIINLVDKYFEMPRHEAMKALDIYKRSGQQETKMGFYCLTPPPTKAMKRLEDLGASSFILDLRDNLGGLVQAGIEIAKLFLNQGETVIYAIGRDPQYQKNIIAETALLITAPVIQLRLSQRFSCLSMEPEDETHLVSWKSQLEEDMKMIQYQDNKNHIIEVLAANDLDCDDLGSICAADTMVLGNYIEEIVVSAVSYHLMNNKDPEYGHGKLVISSSRKDAPKDEAVAVKPETKVGSTVPEASTLTEASASTVKDAGNPARQHQKLCEISPDNEFEKRTRPEVIPASEIGN
ncbi:unnamed protein product [Camellia sinensis]